MGRQVCVYLYSGAGFKIDGPILLKFLSESSLLQM